MHQHVWVVRVCANVCTEIPPFFPLFFFFFLSSFCCPLCVTQGTWTQISIQTKQTSFWLFFGYFLTFKKYWHLITLQHDRSVTIYLICIIIKLISQHSWLVSLQWHFVCWRITFQNKDLICCFGHSLIWHKSNIDHMSNISQVEQVCFQVYEEVAWNKNKKAHWSFNVWCIKCIIDTCTTWI